MEFLARLVLGQAPAVVAAHVPLPDLGRGVVGEVGGDLVRAEVGGQRGAGGTFGQGALGHGGLSGMARHRQANRYRVGVGGEGEKGAERQRPT
ncbi:hypothetical protein [Streptomyces aurantiogriseus]|uniref:Uncharacterized protein n=1 Tax=Streptomyces aurantiogriseus TaxID=66870 RepID=A0A918FPW1_9ACTN|nr:hypothetical protein [Streptomyces aurantiogriseus]GGR65089.1 hypothetical protein GCM10010251_96950 [Streptomyces aurantiogriseus]